MGGSKLKMNDDKIELMAIGTRSKLSPVIPSFNPMSISVCWKPWFLLNEKLSMDAHIKYLCRDLFFQLCRIFFKNPLLPVH